MPTPSLSAQRCRSDAPFWAAMMALGGVYVLLVAALLWADIARTSPALLWQAFQRPEIAHALRLSLASSFLSTLLALGVAVPLGYLLSRSEHGEAAAGWRRWALAAIETLLEMPIVLPPVVVGFSLLILFQWGPLRGIADRVVFQTPAIVLAQFTVVAALAVRMMRVTFDQIPVRHEQVALTLGASRWQAFWRVTLPQARRGMAGAAALGWTRALGEFGPVLVFAGSTRMRTEVLPTTVYLEMQAGDLEAALAVSVGMVLLAATVLILVRIAGFGRGI